MPLKDDVVGGTVWWGASASPRRKVTGNPELAAFCCAAASISSGEVDADRRVSQFGHPHGEKARPTPTSRTVSGRARHFTQEIEPGLVLCLREHIMARRQVKSAARPLQ